MENQGKYRMIDEIDRQIITLLQQDARISNAAIAGQVGLTASTVHERVKKLERKGIIKGYVALVDAGLLDKSITAYIRLSVGSSGQEDYGKSKNSVRDVCQTEPDVLECHGVAGEDCYVLKICVSTPKELENLIERIRCSAHVTRTVTSIVLSTIKENSAIVPG